MGTKPSAPSSPRRPSAAREFTMATEGEATELEIRTPKGARRFFEDLWPGSSPAGKVD
jgi:hypothetical protein